MKFWYYWWIGVAITVLTRIGINLLSEDSWTCEYDYEWKSNDVEVLMHIPVFICISLVGGIAVAKFLGTLDDIGSYIFLAVLVGVITYIVVWLILGVYHFERILSQICFVVVFIVSVVCWTIPINNYNENIETITEIVTTSTEEREVLYFHNIPVQNVSGHYEISN